MITLQQTQQLNAILAELFPLLPPKVIGVRTGFVVSSSGATRRVLQCEYFGTRNHYCLVSPRPGLRERGIKTLRSSIGVSDDAIAAQILDLGDALAEINNLGAWARSEDPVAQTLEITAERAGQLAMDDYPVLADAYDTLCEALPGVATIRMPASTQDPGQGRHRKCWWEFNGDDGAQLCSLPGSGIPGMLRSYFLQDDERDAERHIQRWAHQLDVEQQALVSALSGLSLLEMLLRPTHIRLEAHE